MTPVSAQLKLDVTIPAEGGIELGAWLFLPEGDGIRPAITMAHGFGGTREHGLERFAQAFAAAGFVVLAHDHRNFGTSGGDLRGDIDPWQQIADWRRAISYLESRLAGRGVPSGEKRLISGWNDDMTARSTAGLGQLTRHYVMISNSAQPKISTTVMTTYTLHLSDATTGRRGRNPAPHLSNQPLLDRGRADKSGRPPPLFIRSFEPILRSFTPSPARAPLSGRTSRCG
jgi:hypothetical protein